MLPEKNTLKRAFCLPIEGEVLDYIFLSSVSGDFPAQQVRVNSGEDLLDGPEYFRLLPPARPPG